MYFCGNGCKDILYTLNWTKQQLPPNSLQNIHAQPQKKKVGKYKDFCLRIFSY